MPARPENAYVLLVINKIGPEVKTANTSSVYTVTIPKDTLPENRLSTAMAKVVSAIREWLTMTSNGKAAYAAHSQKPAAPAPHGGMNINDWSHVARYVPEDWLRSQAVMPYKPGSDLTWISDVLVATVPENEIFRGAVRTE